MSQSCLGLVLRLVSVLSLCCFGDVSVMSRSCLGRVSVLSLSFLVMSRCCFVGFLVVFWGSFSDVLVTSRVMKFLEPQIGCSKYGFFIILLSFFHHLGLSFLDHYFIIKEKIEEMKGGTLEIKKTRGKR